MGRKEEMKRRRLRRILEKNNYVCGVCRKSLENCPFPTPEMGGKIPDNCITIDHVIPLSEGGKNIDENLRPAHANCNVKKGSKIIYGRSWRLIFET